MTQPFLRNRVTWLCYFVLALYSYLLNIFGPITPFLKDELRLSYTVSSFHFSAFALGMIGAGLAGHRLIEKTGRQKALWIGALGMCLNALLLMAGREPLVTISAAFLMGLIGSLILAIVPSVLADQHGELRGVAISEANIVSSLLSAIAPVLVGWFAPTILGWRTALTVAVVCMLVLLFAFGRVSLPPAQTSTHPDGTRPGLPALYWFYWAVVVMSVSIEFCMIFWSADYLKTELGMPTASAAQFVGLFLLGMLIGRTAGSRLERRFGAHRVVSGSLIIAAAGFLIYWTAATPLFGVIGLFITGLGTASLYPLVLSLAIGSAKGSTVRASALASLASGTAIFSLPLILGRLADAVGIRQAYAVNVVLLVAAFLVLQSTVWLPRLNGARETKL